VAFHSEGFTWPGAETGLREVEIRYGKENAVTKGIYQQMSLGGDDKTTSAAG
jgi:hypothetical protein